MPTNSLTDSQCRAAKPTDKPQKFFDGEGLHLYVTLTGSKTWRIAYRVGGKPQQKSFGPYPAVSLAEARKKRDELKAMLRDGIDPAAERRASKPAKGVTFSDACATYWDGRSDVSAGYRANALRAMEMHLVPRLGLRVIGTITRDDLMGELKRMDDAKLYSFVRKVRMWSSQVFDWAVEHKHLAVNPADSIKTDKAFGRRKVQSFAALELADVPALFDRLALERDLNSVIACKLLACTWVRTIELRHMLWTEIDGDTWRIPAGKMKRPNDHMVPLSRQALELLAVMKARERGSVYVFPSDRRLDRPMSENAILYLLHRIGYKGRMTGHGFRSVGSTWANEAGYGADAIERQLAHVSGNSVRGIYNRAAYMPERRAILQAFADWVDSFTLPSR